MRIRSLCLLLLFLILPACAQASLAAAEPAAAQDVVYGVMQDASATPFQPGTLPPIFTSTPNQTETPFPSFTPQPSFTPFASLTPFPTSTITPTVTNTRAPTRTPTLTFVSKGDLHMHTDCSDGDNTYDEMVADLKRNGNTFFSITDHHWCPEIAQACQQEDRLLCFMGVEVTCDSYVEILAIGIRNPISDLMSTADTVAAIHAQGGIAIAAHPSANGARYTQDELLHSGFDAMECLHDGSNNLGFDASALPCVYDSDAHSIEALDPWTGFVCTIPIYSIGDLRTAIQGRMCYSAQQWLPKTPGDWELPASPAP